MKKFSTSRMHHVSNKNAINIRQWENLKMKKKKIGEMEKEWFFEITTYWITELLKYKKSNMVYKRAIENKNVEKNVTVFQFYSPFEIRESFIWSMWSEREYFLTFWHYLAIIELAEFNEFEFAIIS